MSFYLEDDDEDRRYSLGGIFPSSQKMKDDQSQSEGGADHFVCDNCGSRECYMDEASGGLVCIECHTQSQTIIATSQTELEYDDTMMLAGRISGGHLKTSTRSGTSKKRRRRPLEELDQSTTLPTTEQCIMGFQRILKASCRKVNDCFMMQNYPKQVRKAAQHHCLQIWMGYLEGWMQGAEFFGRLYPEMRFSFRDAFLTFNLRVKVLQTLTHNAAKKVRVEMIMANDVSMDEITTAPTSDELSTAMKREVLPPLGDDRIEEDISSVPVEIIQAKNDNDNDEDDDDDNLDSNLDDASRVFHSLNDLESSERVRRGGRKSSYRPKNPIHVMIHRHQKRLKKRTLGRRSTALLISPSMQMVAAIIALAYSPYGVTYHDIRLWIQDGTLPLLHSFPFLTAQEKKQLKLIQPFFRMNELPSVIVLEKIAFSLQVASGYIPRKLVLNKRRTSGGEDKPSAHAVPQKISLRQLTPRTLPLVTGHAVAQLGLSQEVLNGCLALMGLPICEVVEKQKKKEKKRNTHEWLPRSLIRCRPDKVVGMTELAGVIVTACQFIPRWDEVWYINMGIAGTTSDHDTAIRNLFPSTTESYLQFMENNYLVTENCVLLNDEEQTIKPFPTVRTPIEQGGEMDGDSHFDHTAVVEPSSTIFQPMNNQANHHRPLKRLGSIAVKEEESRWSGGVPSIPIGPFVEFVSYKLGVNPQLVLHVCEELSEEMVARNLKRKQQRSSGNRK